MNEPVYQHDRVPLEFQPKAAYMAKVVTYWIKALINCQYFGMFLRDLTTANKSNMSFKSNEGNHEKKLNKTIASANRISPTAMQRSRMESQKPVANLCIQFRY